MAIEYINTLQGDILKSYNNEALANLGQRMGAKGDSIVIKKFNIESLLDKEEGTVIPSDILKYIVLQYDNTNDTIDIYAKSGKHGVSAYYTLKKQDSKVTTITPIEYIGLEGTPQVNNCNVSKTVVDNIYTYFLTGILNDMPIALEFSVIDNNYAYKNCLVVSNNNLYEYIKQDNEINYYVYELATAPESFIDSTSIENIKENLGISNTDEKIELQESDVFRTALDYFANILPKYAISLYNENEYFYGDSVGLKLEILKSIIKELFNDDNVDNEITENENTNPFFVYLPLNFEISFYANDNTGEFYDSLPINAKFIEETFEENTNEDIPEIFLKEAEINGYIVVDATIEKAAVYKAILTYSTDNSISVSTNKLYSIPYIGKDNYWYINDIKTEVTATGKNAGNPNIVILQSTLSSGKENYTYQTFVNTDNKVLNDNDYFAQDFPAVLHTYNIEESTTVSKKSSITELFADPNNYDNNKLTDFTYFLQTGSSVFVAGSKTNTYTFKIKLPLIDKLQENPAFEDIIKNSLFFVVVDNRLSIYETDDYVNGGDNYADNFNLRELSLQHALTNNIDEQSFTTVLFHIINEDGKYTWKPLKSSDNGPALDLGSMIAAPEFARLFVKNGYTPDNYMFSYLLFDKVNINTKNDSGETNIFPIIKNDTSEYYTINKAEQYGDPNEENVMNYTNNLNLTPKFVQIDLNGLDSDYVGELTNNELNDKGQKKKFFTVTNGKITNATVVTEENRIDNLPSVKSTSTDEQISVFDGSVFPMFDFREVITTNQTAMNRLSLISVANDGTTYNAYIGNSANTNEEGTLYIGSSSTNYSMSGNKTVTNDYDKFATFKKINFELPYETQNLSIYKAANNVYFAYMAVDFVENTEETGYIIGHTEEITSKYITTPQSIITYKFNATSYINTKYGNFINCPNSFNEIELKNVIYPKASKPTTLLFVLTFSEFVNGKYTLSSIEQILDNNALINGINIITTTTTADPSLSTIDIEEDDITTTSLDDVINDYTEE